MITSTSTTFGSDSSPNDNALNTPLLTPRTLSGHPDRLAPQAATLQRLMDRILETFEAYGFAPRVQPILEHLDTITQAKQEKGEEDIQKQLYQFEDNGGRSVALRPDHTLGLARFTAQHESELVFPWKTYTCGPVFRGESAQKNRLRSFDQADIDHIGTHSLHADAEIVACLYTALRASVPELKFTLRLNHRAILNGFLLAVGIPMEQHASVVRILDKKSKVGEDDLRGMLMEPAGVALSLQDAERVLAWTALTEQPNETPADCLARVQSLRSTNSHVAFGIEQLETTATYLAALGVDPAYLRIDFSIARGLDYYSGMVFEGTLDALSELGSICAGGRYDHLTGAYLKQARPGVGGSIGVTRLLIALTEGKLIPDRLPPAEVLMVRFSDADALAVLRIAQALRRTGLRVTYHPEALETERSVSFRDQMAFADRNGIPYCVICGKTEQEQGVVTVRNRVTRTQTQFTNVEAAAMAIEREEML